MTTAYDEFGRVISTGRSDVGTTSYTYDVLDRITQVASPFQRTLTYSYTPDFNLQRWTTTVHVDGIGDYVYAEDTKGTLAYAYDDNDNRTQKVYPDGTTDYSLYDTARMKLTGVVRGMSGLTTPPALNLSSTSPFTSLTYDTAGRLLTQDRRYDSLTRR